MVAVALLLPPLMLCAVLALGRYEERLLSGPEADRRAQHRRALRAVPDLPSEETAPQARRASPAGRTTRGGGRHAA
ncbi:hypothetical protein [Streptomyces sp. NPDC008001]|uniref:hypothetical protein n=1 Tax=Streptomyces sp. NPDC008001 TaxID=3364804 RepID=UPI0036EDAA3D